MMEMILRFTFTFSAHIKIIRATVGFSRFQFPKHVETENDENDFPNITSLSLSHPRLLSPTGREWHVYIHNIFPVAEMFLSLYFIHFPKFRSHNLYYKHNILLTEEIFLDISQNIIHTNIISIPVQTFSLNIYQNVIHTHICTLCEVFTQFH